MHINICWLKIQVRGSLSHLIGGGGGPPYEVLGEVAVEQILLGGVAQDHGEGHQQQQHGPHGDSYSCVYSLLTLSVQTWNCYLQRDTMNFSDDYNLLHGEDRK